MAKQPHVMVYALSTCIWCRKTKELLSELGVKYEHLDVDTLDGAEKEKALSAIKEANPACSFPTVIIDGKCVVGFREEQLRKLLGK